MKFKHPREVKVAILAIVGLFLLYFGFNYLKGVNIFHPVHTYHGVYAQLNGLTEQAPVYIRGYKVGQVDHIHYDFTRDSAFTVDISVHEDIRVPHGATMAIVADGILGGTAIMLDLPAVPTDGADLFTDGDTLPTHVVPGLVESLQAGLLSDLTAAVNNVSAMVQHVDSQLVDDHLYRALAHIDTITDDFTYISRDVKHLMADRVPRLIEGVDSAVVNIDAISSDLRNADLPATVARVDSALDNVNRTVEDVRAGRGTLGMLLNDSTLYTSIHTTVNSADSLLVDLKANPKRYVHFSLFGSKNKK